MYACLFFFFKQKTAYEMRISDWSSDVCSSDLRGGADRREEGEPRAELRVDRRFRPRERAVDPIMRLDRIGQLGVLVLRGEAVVDDLLVRGVLLELGRGFAQIRRIPEALPDAHGLVHDLLLFEQLGEQEVERDDRHDENRKRLNSSH